MANLFFNIGRRHSFKPKPLIDWDLILVMEPSTILGAIIGGYLNKVNYTILTAIPCTRFLTNIICIEHGLTASVLPAMITCVSQPT